MAWGRGSPAEIDDLVKRVADNDAKLQSLTILRFRRLNDSDVEALATALQCNSTLQELNCSSHSITSEASGALGSMLQQNRALKRISIGNSSLGDQVGPIANATEVQTSHLVRNSKPVQHSPVPTWFRMELRRHLRPF